MRSAGVQGSTTDSEREAVTESPLIGPVAMYMTTQGVEVVALEKLEGGEFMVVTEMVPDAVSEA